MKRVFRVPFFKSRVFRGLTCKFLFMSVLAVPIVYYIKGDSIGQDILLRSIPLYIIFVLCLVYLYSVLLSFYVVVDDRSVVMQNLLLPIWRNDIEISRIKRCVLGHNEGEAFNYFKIRYDCKSKVIHPIELVDYADYDDLIAELTKRGIEVEIDGVLLKK